MKIISFVILFLNQNSCQSEVSQRPRSTDTLNMFKSDIGTSEYYCTIQYLSRSKCSGVQLHAFLTLEPDGVNYQLREIAPVRNF
jgi:hypothetical protein